MFDLRQRGYTLGLFDLALARPQGEKYQRAQEGYTASDEEGPGERSRLIDDPTGQKHSENAG